MMQLADRSLSVGQTLQSVKASRALSTTYTNITGRAIAIIIYLNFTAGNGAALVITGTYTVAGYAMAANGSGPIFMIVKPGDSYALNPIGTGATITEWMEIR